VLLRPLAPSYRKVESMPPDVVRNALVNLTKSNPYLWMAPNKKLDFKDYERPILHLGQVDVEVSERIDLSLASWGAVQGVHILTAA
jgi:hypothetical protein